MDDFASLQPEGPCTVVLAGDALGHLELDVGGMEVSLMKIIHHDSLSILPAAIMAWNMWHYFY